MLIVYSHVPLLERYRLQQYYVIHVIFMYNAHILVLSHYTKKGKHQEGGNLLFTYTCGCIQNTPTMANSLFMDNKYPLQMYLIMKIGCKIIIVISIVYHHLTMIY